MLSGKHPTRVLLHLRYSENGGSSNHEIYHAKTADKITAGRIEALNNSEGIHGISITAEKDKLETISESGVLFERGEYDKVPDAARRLMESVFGGKYG